VEREPQRRAGHEHQPRCALQLMGAANFRCRLNPDDYDCPVDFAWALDNGFTNEVSGAVGITGQCCKLAHIPPRAARGLAAALWSCLLRGCTTVKPTHDAGLSPYR
jgi:hypothetical protein